MDIRGADTVVLDALLKKPYRLTVIASGAGAGIQSLLWNRAGTSNFLTGAYFPYDRKATADLLGFEPEKSVAKKTAIQMAVEAYIRSCRGTAPGEPLGLGLTAAVTTSRERMGENRGIAVLLTPFGAYGYDLTLSKSRLNITLEEKRIRDGASIDAMAVTLLGQHLGVGGSAGIFSIPDSELMDVLYENPLFMPNGQRPGAWKELVDTEYKAMVPTSGNPPHVGHYGMVREMEAGHGPTLFAVTSDSVHKPSLSVPELLQRVAYFRSGNVPVLLTRKDPLFIDKARQFRDKIFGIGVDALERLLDPKWSTQSIEEMLAEFWNLETNFMVFTRNNQSLFPTLDRYLPVHSRWRHLFWRGNGSWDVSSAQLRAASADPKQPVVTPIGIEDQGLS